MTPKERESAVSKLIAACQLIAAPHGQKLMVKTASRYHRMLAQQVYEEQYKEAIAQESFSDDELLNFLIAKGLWDAERQKLLDDFTKDIEEFKYKMFKLNFKSDEREQARKMLNFARDNVTSLLTQRNSYNHLSASGSAEMARIKCLTAFSIYDINNQPLYSSEAIYWKSTNDSLLEYVIKEIYQKRLSEREIRDIARNEPWRSTWNCRKAEGQLFGLPAVDLSDEQRMLCVWSGIYDSAYEHPECPSEEVVNDDDLMDGWMIMQKRKREENQGDNLTASEKIKNCNEVFIPVNNAEDAKKVDALNDNQAKAIKRQRMNLINEKGVVREQDMPDSQQKMRMQLAQMQMKGDT